MSRSITSVALAVALIAAGWSYAQVATPQDAQQRQEAQQQQQEAQQQRDIQQRQGVQQQRGIQQQQQLEHREHEARFRGEAAVDRHTETVRVTELIGVTGLTVRNLQEENLGSIDDIVIVNGCANYVVLSVGGFLGIGDRLVAVPWDAFEHQREADRYQMVLNIDRQRLEQAPVIDRGDWPDFTDEQFTREVDTFFERDLRARDRRELDRERPDTGIEERPERLERPERPDRPETPEQPERPEQPEQPEQPQQPQQPDQPQQPQEL